MGVRRLCSASIFCDTWSSGVDASNTVKHCGHTTVIE
jgi:hypothetical protein